jgi:dsRNA-specific ribonuclease
MRAEEFTRRTQELAGWQIVVETYRLGETYFTTISSVDPGARFARAQGASREKAEQTALEKATKWLGQTRRFPITNE